MWFETDTNLLGIIVSGAYQYISYGNAGSAWQTLSGTNGWSASSNTPRYRLVGDVVQIDGAMNGGSASNANFATLPSGFRPPATRTYAAGCTAGVIGGESSFISVAASGVMSSGGVTPGTGSMTLTIGGQFPIT
jgi:hypothetical protein